MDKSSWKPRYLNGESPEQIAREFGISRMTVYRHLSQVVESMRPVGRPPDLNPTHRRCSKCKQVKPIDLFYKRNTISGYGYECKKCPAAYKGRDLRKYGLTQDDIDAMLLKQGGNCAICGIHPDYILHVDHCHATGEVRGLLCNECNSGLGMFKDNIASLERAVEYLKANSLLNQGKKH